ncbi:MAG: hypothetical protein LBD36_00840 [Holosporales bacterium]|jgi:hypothetical protein|nr:hypothetical protein [Holosporales bacterium]
MRKFILAVLAVVICDGKYICATETTKQKKPQTESSHKQSEKTTSTDANISVYENFINIYAPWTTKVPQTVLDQFAVALCSKRKNFQENFLNYTYLSSCLGDTTHVSVPRKPNTHNGKLLSDNCLCNAFTPGVLLQLANGPLQNDTAFLALHGTCLAIVAPDVSWMFVDAIDARAMRGERVSHYQYEKFYEFTANVAYTMMMRATQLRYDMSNLVPLVRDRIPDVLYNNLRCAVKELNKNKSHSKSPEPVDIGNVFRHEFSLLSNDNASENAAGVVQVVNCLAKRGTEAKLNQQKKNNKNETQAD